MWLEVDDQARREGLRGTTLEQAQVVIFQGVVNGGEPGLGLLSDATRGVHM